MSTVYLAEDTRLPGKLWAVKQYRGMGRQFSIPESEVATLLQLNHPLLPHVVDFFPPSYSSDVESDSGYLVMEWIDGVTLDNWLEQRKGRIPLERSLTIGMQICELLHYLHHLKPAPIIYRDLKPSNIMLDRQGHIRLIDFGIARNFKPDSQTDTIPLGTLAFAAPEQLKRKKTDTRSDLYSLGTLLFYLITGGGLYSVDRKPLRRYRHTLPLVVEETIQRLLEQEPEDRYQSALEARRALQACFGGEEDAPVRNDALIGEEVSQYPVGSKAVEKRNAAPKKTVVVVGSLYPGAGATFVTIAMARAWRRSRVTTAVVEAGAKEPELAALLRLSGISEPAFSDGYYDDEVETKTERPHKSKAASSGKAETSWLPRNPVPAYWLHEDPTARSIDSERLQQAILGAEPSLVLVDIADGWLEPRLKPLCEESAALVVVLDAYPFKWEQVSTRRSLQQLLRWTESGLDIHWVLNKDAAHAGRKDRMDSLPGSPRCILPYISAEERLEALDKRMLIQDRYPLRDKLDSALMPLLEAVAPSETWTTRPKRKALWTFF